MFLHAGASLHGHEYSNRQQQPPTRLPFLRSALRQPTGETPNPDTRAPSPSLARSRSHSRSASISASIAASAVSSAAVGAPSTFSSRPMSYHEQQPPKHPRTTRPRPTSDYMPKRELSVRFRDPETDDELDTLGTVQSEDEGSTAFSDAGELSDSSVTTTKRTRRKRSPRKSTQYVLAHPAPRLRTKQRKLVQIRPRLLLQLQELSDKRPIPAFDVVPSCLICGSAILPRLAKRFPRLFRAKPVLGINDLLIVRSEDYDAPAAPGAGDGEDSLDQRDLLAIISPLPHMGDDAAEIVLEDGTTWEASLMSNGSYEFIGVDERGRISTARWVKKVLPTTTLATRPLTMDTPPSSPIGPEVKWTFSIINPETRRHPIMGSLVSKTLEIFDTYNTMSSSSGRYPPTRSAFDNGGTQNYFSTGTAAPEGRLTVAVPEDIKLLMVVTSAWINLRQEGWPTVANFKQTPTTLQRRNTSTSSTANGSANSSPAHTRVLSFPVRGSPAMSNGNFSPTSQNPPGSPTPSGLDAQIQELQGRRRSMSSAGNMVRRLITPRASEEGGRPPEFEVPPYVEVEKERPPSSRRLSIRQIKNKIFRRRSNSQAQPDDMYKYKLEY